MNPAKLAPTKNEIAEHLRFLADDMDAIALAMDYYGGTAPWALHAKEMIGAAEMAREWADEIISTNAEAKAAPLPPGPKTTT